MKKRVFAWIMVFMMVLTGIPVFGEGEKPEVVPTVSSETEMVSETPIVSTTGEPMLDTAVSPEPTVVPETTVEPEKSVVPEVTVEPEASATPEPEISVSPDVPNESEVATAGEAAPEIDFEKTVSENPSFRKGYVKLTGSARVYASAGAADAYGELSKGVVYAIRRVNARMEIAFATENGVETAFASAKAAKPMSDGAIASFKTGMAGVSAAHTYVDASGKKYDVSILTLTVYESDAKNATPAEAEKPTEPATSAEAERSAENAMPEEAEKPTEPATPAEAEKSATPAEVEKPMESATPVEPERPAETAAPAEVTPSEPGVEDVTEEQRSESAGEERRAAKIILTLEKKENRNDNELGAGEKARLSAQVLDENGEDISEAVTVKFESVDAKVLALMDEAATGTETQVQAVAVGACEVRASAGSVTETVKVTVKPAPTALTFVQESLMAGVNEEIQLKYEINAGSLGEVDADGWYSSNEAVATVKGGVVKTHAAGTAVIRAVITNAFLGTRVEGYCTISVLEKPETFSLNYTSLSLNEGQKIELKASFDGKDAYAHVSYSVPADQDEVVLTDKGENIVEVHAMRAGQTVVTAYINESLSATCEIEVLEAASQIELGTARTEIGVGEIISLNPVVKTGRGKVLETVGVTVKSSNRAYVDVEGTRIKGVKTGSAVITLTTDNGYEKQISYTVRKAPAKVTLGKTTETLPVGETCTLTAELPSGTAGAIHWTSADERIAVVEEGKENGAATVRAIGEGAVKVTAKTYNGHTAVCTVKVTPVAQKIAFEKSSYVLSKGMTLAPKLVFEPENATGFARFAIVDESAEGIATIDERTGEVRALGEGSIQIDATVQTANGQALTAKAYVQLKPEIAQIQLSGNERLNAADEMKVGLGEIYALSPAACDANGEENPDAEIALSTSNSKIAAVNGHQIKGVKTGTATITLSVAGVSRKIRVTVVKAPTSVKLNRTSLTVSAGETVELLATLPNAVGTVAWKTGDTDIAAIEKTEVVNGNTTKVLLRTAKAGTVTIMATSYDGKKKATCKLRVTEAPTGLVFAEESYSVSEGATVQTSVAVLPAGGNYTVRYEVEDETVASVGDAGRLTAKREGTTFVTAKVVDYRTGTILAAKAQVLVTPGFEKLEIQSDRMADGVLRIGLREVVTLDCDVFDRTGAKREDARLHLTAGNAKVAAVSGMRVKGVKTGKTKVAVLTENGVTREIDVEVVAAPTAVKLNKGSAKLSVGETLQLEAKLTKGVGSVSWSTSNAKVALVTNGLVTAKSTGTATIRVRTYNGKTAACKVTVLDAPTGLVFDKAVYELLEGRTVRVKGVFLPTGSYGNVAFEIVGSDIATVDERGVVEALRAGEAVIRATTRNYEEGRDVVAESRLVIHTAPVRILIGNAVAQIGKGEVVQLDVHAYDGYGEDITESTTFTVKTSKKTIVAVQQDETGICVKGTGTGKATITIQAKNGAKATLTINAKKAPGKLAFDAKKQKNALAVGESISLAVKDSAGGGCSGYTFECEPAGIVQIDEKGLVTALHAGMVTVKASAYNGKSCECVLTVHEALQSLAFAQDSLTVGEQRQQKPELVVTPANGYDYEIRYTLEDMRNPDGSPAEKAIAAVGEDGTVKGLYAGSATLRASYTAGDIKKEATVAIVVERAVCRIEFPKDQITSLGRGSECALSPIGYDARGEKLEDGFACRLTSSSTKCISVTDDQTLRAVKTGRAKITCVSEDNEKVKKDIWLTVVKAPTKVVVKESVDMPVGATLRLIATVTPKVLDGVRFESENEEIAKVDAQTGWITAVSVGETRVVATTYNGKTDACRVVIHPLIEKVSFERETYILGKGSTFTPAYSSAPEDALGTLAFASDDAAIAAVDEKTGLVTGVSVGETTLRVRTTENEAEVGTVRVVVKEAPKTVEIEALRPIGVGETAKLNVKAADETDAEILATFSYKSSNTKIAKVSAKGEVKGIARGTAKITVTAVGGASQTITVTVGASPVKVALNRTQMKLQVSETAQLEAKLPSGQAGNIAFASGNEAVATVDADTGLITGVGAGAVTITAKTYNGKTAKCTVTVAEAPESIAFGATVYSVGEGKTLKPELIMEPADSYGTPVYEIACDDPDYEIASAHASGAVTGQFSGSATLTARVKRYDTGDELTSSCEILVLPAPRRIELESGTVSVGVKESVTIEPVAYDARGNRVETEFTLKSVKTAYVTVSGLKVTGKKVGSSAVTVTAANGFATKLTVKVLAAPGSVGISRKQATISECEKLRLAAALPKGTAGRITWSSSNEALATVEDGLVTVYGTGTVTITAKAFNNKKATCVVTIKSEPTGIWFDTADGAAIGEGSKYTRKAVIREEEVGRITYSSSNPYVAYVNASTGEVLARREGETEIVATVMNRKTGEAFTASYSVKVTPAPVKIRVDNAQTRVGVGESINLRAIAIDGMGRELPIELAYTSSNKAYMTVSADGTVKGIKKGSVAITIKAYNGLTRTVALTVVDAPASVRLSAQEINVVKTNAAGYECRLLAWIGTERAMNLRWTSSDETVVTVENGVLTGARRGTATVTATTYNGKTASCIVHVYNEPTGIRLSSDELTIYEDMTATLKVIFADGEWSPVEFISANEEIAEVTSEGRVTGMLAGTTEIRVKTVNGVSNVCALTVKRSPVRITCDTAENGCVGLPITWAIKSLAEEYQSNEHFTYKVYADNRLVETVGSTTERTLTYTPKIAGAYSIEMALDDFDVSIIGGKVTVAAKLIMGSFHGEEIAWRVLTVKDGKALVLTEKILTARGYFNPSWIKYKYAGWDGSHIGSIGSNVIYNTGRRFYCSPSRIPKNRALTEFCTEQYLNETYHARWWCNGTFLNGSFTAAERTRIAGNGSDRIFFLSAAEVREYLPENADRKAVPTAYAISQNSRIKNTKCWWLRDSGKYTDSPRYVVNAMHVSGTGVISTAGSDVGHSDVGYRPAMWITIGG